MYESKTFENIVELIKALTWPCVAVYIYSQLRGPIRQLAAELPKKFAAAREVKAGAFSLVVQEAALQIGQPEIAAALKSLPPNARSRFLQIGGTSRQVASITKNPAWTRYWISDEEMIFRSLKHSLLVTFIEDPDEYRTFVSTLGLKVINKMEVGTLYEVVTPLKEEDEKRIMAQRYSHSALGRSAFDLIVDIVSRL